MSRPYDDDRYLEWYREFQKLIAEFLDTEGNSAQTLREELENALENASEA